MEVHIPIVCFLISLLGRCVYLHTSRPVDPFGVVLKLTSKSYANTHSYSGGGALGIKMATEYEGTKKFVVQIVGDGTFLFSVPGSVYWISQRYKIPVLTIVLNNKGDPYDNQSC